MSFSKRFGWLLVMVFVVVASAGVAAAVPEGPEFPSAEWTEREANNFLITRESGNEQLTDPAFQARLTEQSATNLAEYLQFQIDHGFANAGNLCAHWQFTCAGDPFRYPGTDPFYDDATVTETLFYDRGCARLSGRVWRPNNVAAGETLPGVVVTTGSVQAPEPLYWWFAQALVTQGYEVMTFDVRGQGRSDTQTPDGEQGGNSNPAVFWDGTVDAIDFFHSTPSAPYQHNVTCAAGPAAASAPLPAAAAFNPHHDVLDRDRLGLAGHSLGARGVAVVQSMDPWEGTASVENPVDVIVAWDSLSSGDDITPRVPAMGQTSEYGLFNVPFTAAPDPDGHTAGFAQWADASQPVSQFTIGGSTHYEWSLIPTTPVANFSASSWNNWGRPMAEHFSVAWMDRWLKVAGEPGFDTADARLVDDAPFCERYSFYFRSARSIPARSGSAAVSDDIRAACLAAAPTMPSSGASGTPNAQVEDDTAANGSDTLPATGSNQTIAFFAAAALLATAATIRRTANPATRCTTNR